MNLFPFQTLRTIISGASAIDLEHLDVQDLLGAERFLASYGFDWHDPRDRRQVEQVRVAALSFLDETLLNPVEVIPQRMRQLTDVRQMLVMVSAKRVTQSSLWSCAILRVMHTIAHAGSDLSVRYGERIREQVLSRIEPHIREFEGKPWIGDVPLVRFETRAQKSMASVVMKLLHKPANVGADVFDRIALRFVTVDRFSTLLLVRFLRANHVIQHTNIKPSRSRNTLINLERLEELVKNSELTLKEIATEVESWPYPEENIHLVNPFSGSRYHSIQFTCRQRVKIPGANGEELAFFIPFEIQVLDEVSYQASRIGEASHHAYKHRQRQTCRRRVLGALFKDDSPSSGLR